MKVGLLVVVAALAATLALLLWKSAKTQKQKREARAAPEATPVPSLVSATPANKPATSSGEEPEWSDTHGIRNLDDARQFFEAMQGSHYFMMRDDPDGRDEYVAMKIDKAQERQWRRDMIAKLCERLLNPATDAGELWLAYSRLDKLCEDQNDPESVLKIYEVTRRIADRLPVKDGIIVAEDISGRGAYTYETGLIYLAVKHGLKDVAQDLADYSMSLAQRAKTGNIDAERAELAVEKCLAVKSHFSLR